MEKFVKKRLRWNKARGRIGRLNEDQDTVSNEGKPVNKKFFQLLQFIVQL